jgi:uncharacterized membrane-anchored protein
MNRVIEIRSSKVPEVTLAFWIISIAATTLGETGGDALSMTMQLGYAISTAIFFALFIVTVAAQVTSKSLHPFLYWSVIVATSTAGTTMADYADRSLGIGYVGGSLILFAILMLVLGLWRFSMGSVSIANITSPKVEIFYWTAILFSNTLGTALGDLLVPHFIVLAGVHPDTAARRDTRRPAHKAPGEWWTGSQPHQFVFAYCDFYDRLYSAHVKARGQPSRTASARGVT